MEEYAVEPRLFCQVNHLIFLLVLLSKRQWDQIQAEKARLEYSFCEAGHLIHHNH